MKAKVYTGTASWTDPGFVADWYPKGLRPADRLRWYADHFSLVEINSSFYAVPRIENVENWRRQTPDSFLFNVKAHKLLSRHSVSPKFLPAALRKLASARKDKVIPDARLEAAVARALVESVQPLCDAGKMGAILVQFSPAFRPRTNRLEEMDVFLESGPGCSTGQHRGQKSPLTPDG
jgi:uncharacterized protein YecE (DUF72 family)